MESWHAILISTAVSAAAVFTTYCLGRRERRKERRIKRDTDRAEWVGSVNSDRKNFKKFIQEIRYDVREIREDIKSIFRGLGGLGNQTVSVSSPLSLTKLGKEIASEIGAYKWAESEAAQVAEKVARKSAYETEEFCMRYCVYQLHPDPEYLLRLEHSAFTHGVNLRAVKEVLAVVLRDQILKTRD